MNAKKEKARTISPRITDSTRKELAKAYGNANAGATRAIRSWTTLREETRKELFEFFSKAELKVITKAHKDVKFYPELAMNDAALRIRIEVALTENDDHELTKKIEQLTPAERFFLVEMAFEG
jgi:hypothetical protein